MSHHRDPAHGRPFRISSGTYRLNPPTPTLPVAGVDYPRNRAEFERLYADEQACQLALERLRWPQGFECTNCGWHHTPSRAGVLLCCSHCGFLEAVTTNTIFHGTAKPLLCWFRGLWHMAGQQTGTSPYELRELLGIREPRLAWEYLARVHRALGNVNQEPLRGPVEVGRCRVETVDLGPQQREQAVIALVVEQGEELGRVRLRTLVENTPAAMQRFLVESVAPGSVVWTGPWQGYELLGEAGFSHRVRRGPTRTSTASLPAALAVARRLRQWLWATKGLTRARLDSYLHEFVFRYPRRSCPQGLVFFHLLRAAVQGTQVVDHAQAAAG